MDLQTLTLLSSIIAIISGLLSLSKKMRDFGFVKVIRTLCIYILPVLFIQQILIFTLNLQFSIMWINLLYPVAWFIYIKIKNQKYTGKKLYRLYDAEFIILLLVMISVLIFYIREQFFTDTVLFNFFSMRRKFIKELQNYHITFEMFQFLAENLYVSLCSLLDSTNLFLLPYTLIRFYFLQKAERKKQMSMNVDTVSLLSCAIVSTAISSGAVFYLLNKILKLF